MKESISEYGLKLAIVISVKSMNEKDERIFKEFVDHRILELKKRLQELGDVMVGIAKLERLQ